MKKIISVLMVAIMLSGAFSLSAFAENEETEKTWSTSFDEATGTLTVSGTGIVEALYTDGYFRADYYTYERDEDDYSVKKLIIEEGITSIRLSFSRMHSLKEVVLPNSLTDIMGCFNECSALTSVTLPAGVGVWYHSFQSCNSLSDINFNGSVNIGSRFEYCEDKCFYNLPSLKSVTIPSGSFLGGAFRECKNLKKVTLNGVVEVGGAGCEAMLYGLTFENAHKDLIVYVDNEDTVSNLRWASVDVGPLTYKIVNTSEVTTAPTTQAQKNENTTKKALNDASGTVQSESGNVTTTQKAETTENSTQNTSVEAPKTTEKTTTVNSQNTNEKSTDNKTIIIISVVAVIIIAGAIAVIIIKKKK